MIFDKWTAQAEAHNLAGKGALPQAEALSKALAALPGAVPNPSQKTGRDEARALKSLGYIGAGGEYASIGGGMDPKAFIPLYDKLNAARALADARRWTEAEPVYASLLAAFPRSTVLACELGLVAMAQGKTAEAESHLRSALDRDPGNSHALLGMANLAIGRQDYKRAEAHLLDVMKLDPDDLEANFDLGALYAQNLGEPAKAIRYWERFLELQPDDPEAPRIRRLVEEIKAAPAKIR